MKTGIELITEEREKQISKYGFTAEHHAYHDEWYLKGQMAYAASLLSEPNRNDCYRKKPPYGWDNEWFRKMMNKDYKERLIAAGALIASELDRIELKDIYEAEATNSN